MDVDSAIDQWRQGERRLNAASPERQPTQERIAEAIVAELRKRLGGRFTAAELSDLYARGTDWCVQVAIRLAPEDPWAWDASVSVDAAFARYLRAAADYAGGRRILAD